MVATSLFFLNYASYPSFPTSSQPPRLSTSLLKHVEFFPVTAFRPFPSSRGASTPLILDHSDDDTDLDSRRQMLSEALGYFLVSFAPNSLAFSFQSLFVFRSPKVGWRKADVKRAQSHAPASSNRSRKRAIENKLGEGIPEMEEQIVVVIYHLGVSTYRKVTTETQASGHRWFQKLKVRSVVKTQKGRPWNASEAETLRFPRSARGCKLKPKRPI